MSDYTSAYTGAQVDEAVAKVLDLPADVAALDANGKIAISQELLSVVYHVENYTLASGDEAHKMHASGDVHISVTIPPNVFQVGTFIPFYILSGTLTVLAGSGVVLEKVGGYNKATGVALAGIFQRATNYWVLGGFNT